MIILAECIECFKSYIWVELHPGVMRARPLQDSSDCNMPDLAKEHLCQYH